MAKKIRWMMLVEDICSFALASGYVSSDYLLLRCK